MSKVTIRQRNQITLPAQTLAALGVGVGDVGEAFVQGGALVLRFHDRRAAQDRVTQAFGSCPDTWGSTPQEVEETLERDRRSWERAR